MTLLFDLDGTIIDSTEAIVESFGVAYNTFGTPVPESHAIIELIGLPLLTMFERLGIPSTLAQDYVDTYKAHYRTVATAKTYILPFAKEAIHKASAFATLGVVTTKTGRYSEEILTHLGVRDYFSTIVGFEHVTHPKPHPEPILTAAGILEATPTPLIAPPTKPPPRNKLAVPAK